MDKRKAGNMPGLDRPENWPVTRGCTPVSSGCDNCYVERLSKAQWRRWYPNGFGDVAENENQLQKPLRRRNRSWFEPSMHADLFHKDVSTEFILKVFDIMRQTPQHFYQICTKRANRMVDFIAMSLPDEWLDQLGHVMMGVSVESPKYLWRIERLRSWPHGKYVEFQPLLKRIQNVDLYDIDWVKIGCETGKDSRPTELRWIHTLIDEAKLYRIPVTVTAIKQNGKLVGMPIIDGYKYVEKPRQYHLWRDYE